ncbi:MAG: hypothetical protein ACPGJU_10265 [Coraliomargarita sp.]
MKFLEKLFSAEQGSRIHPALEQPEREAIVDLLIIAIYVDNHLSLAESAELEESAGVLGWESVTDLDTYISTATARARDARSAESLRAEYIQHAVERLSSDASKERALELLNKVFLADGKNEVEKAFFKQVETALG